MGKPEGKGGGKVDPRFAAMHSDPRFQRFPKQKNKVVVDKRFAGTLLNFLAGRTARVWRRASACRAGGGKPCCPADVAAVDTHVRPTAASDARHPSSYHNHGTFARGCLSPRIDQPSPVRSLPCPRTCRSQPLSCSPAQPITPPLPRPRQACLRTLSSRRARQWTSAAAR